MRGGSRPDSHWLPHLEVFGATYGLRSQAPALIAHCSRLMFFIPGSISLHCESVAHKARKTTPFADDCDNSGFSSETHMHATPPLGCLTSTVLQMVNGVIVHICVPFQSPLFSIVRRVCCIILKRNSPPLPSPVGGCGELSSLTPPADPPSHYQRYLKSYFNGFNQIPLHP